jgi:hypothetical protein
LFGQVVRIDHGAAVEGGDQPVNMQHTVTVHADLGRRGDPAALFDPASDPGAGLVVARSGPRMGFPPDSAGRLIEHLGQPAVVQMPEPEFQRIGRRRVMRG